MNIFISNSSPTGGMLTTHAPVNVRQVWRWGADNRLPEALSTLSRNSTIHRRILNDKADYISGRGFNYDSSTPALAKLVEAANGSGQTLRAVMARVAFDKCLFGNAFLELAVDPTRKNLSLFHQDASRCRLSKERTHIVMHHNWAAFSPKEAVSLPLFPQMQKQADGSFRTIIHYKEYEPTFENYGLPKYIAALGAAAIAYKTDRWNVSRLDNAFQPSGVMVLDGQVDTQEAAAEIARTAEKKFAGKPGQVMFLVKNGVEGDTTKFIPLNTDYEGDWRGLHQQATSDIIVAHSWFRTLSGIDYSTGFSPDRVQYEYEIALNTLITVEQQELLEPIKVALEDILRVDCSSLEFINRPPFDTKPKYLKIWEARQADGLPFDPKDPAQNQFLGI